MRPWLTSANKNWSLLLNYPLLFLSRPNYLCKNFATASVRVRTCSFS